MILVDVCSLVDAYNFCNSRANTRLCVHRQRFFGSEGVQWVFDQMLIKKGDVAQAFLVNNQQVGQYKYQALIMDFYKYIMRFVIFFLLLLLILAQDDESTTVLGESGDSDNPDVLVDTGSQDQLPSSSPGSTGTSADGRTATLALTIAPEQPSSWSYLQQSPIGSSKWIYPNGSFVLYPRYRIYCYTITFHTDCPQNGVTLAVAGTGAIFVQVNGTWLLTWGNPYPTIHKVYIPPSKLTCGCNTIRICVYNYWWPSPLAIIYSLSQSTVGCYNCKNLGVTFYNKRTCKCECVQQCFCYNRLMFWADYPQCGCMCRQVLRCAVTHYFDYQRCQCVCKPKCCKPGYYQHPNSCNCVRFVIVSNPQVGIAPALGLRSNSQDGSNGNSTDGTIQLDSQISSSP